MHARNLPCSLVHCNAPHPPSHGPHHSTAPRSLHPHPQRTPPCNALATPPPTPSPLTWPPGPRNHATNTLSLSHLAASTTLPCNHPTNTLAPSPGLLDHALRLRHLGVQPRHLPPVRPPVGPVHEVTPLAAQAPRELLGQRLARLVVVSRQNDRRLAVQVRKAVPQVLRGRGRWG